MNIYNSSDLLKSLRNDVEQLLTGIEEIKEMNGSALNQQPQPGKWSVLQVLEHLNSYNRYYLPEIQHTLRTNPLLTLFSSQAYLATILPK